MKLKHRTKIILATLAVLATVSGCGVTIEAARVNTGDAARPIPTLIPREGITYALPRTEFEVLQPVTVRVPTSGPLQDVFEGCRRACDASGDVVTDKACDFSIEPSLKFSAPELRTVPVADHSRTYQVSPTAEIFQSLNFKFEIASNGVIEKADSTASNMAYEAISAALSVIAKATTIAMFAPADDGAPPVVNSNPIDEAQKKRLKCYRLSNYVTTLTEPKKGKLKCTDLRAIVSCLADDDKLVLDARNAVQLLYDSAAAAKMDSKLLDSLAANRREQLDSATTKRNEVAALYGLGEGASKEASYQIIVPMDGPPEFLRYEKKVSLGSSIIDGRARIVGVSDNAASQLSNLTGQLKLDTRTYELITAMPLDILISSGDEDATLGRGYRYRVPTFGATTLTVYSDDTASKTIFYGPVLDRKIIAQYGPVAALPSKFKGKGGHVMVKHWPDSGGLQSVEIGAEAIPTSAVTGVLDTAVTQYKARKDKSDAAAATAAAKDSELENLTRQQKILALKKQIKDLEDASKN